MNGFGPSFPGPNSGPIFVAILLDTLDVIRGEP